MSFEVDPSESRDVPESESRSEKRRQLRKTMLGISFAVESQASPIKNFYSGMLEHFQSNINEPFARLAQSLAEQQSSWAKGLIPALEKFEQSFYPPNLRSIEGLRLDDVEKIVMDDGIALYCVPRASIAKAIVRANGAPERRDILVQQWSEILADCRATVDECTSVAVAPYTRATIAALDALDAGHVEAAQALTASILEVLVNSCFDNRYLYTPDKRGRTNDAYDEFGVQEYIAFAPIWQAWQQYFLNSDDPIPHTFSRHATAHTISTKQYTRQNAIQALMIVCGILSLLNERAEIVETGEG